jgi:hypothetical protein
MTLNSKENRPLPRAALHERRETMKEPGILFIGLNRPCFKPRDLTGGPAWSSGLRYLGYKP